VTQSISKRSHPLQSEVSLTGLSAAKSFLNELLYEAQVAWPGSQAELRPAARLPVSFQIERVARACVFPDVHQTHRSMDGWQ